MKFKIFLLFFGMVFLINFISANLVLINQTSFTINKTQSATFLIPLTIQNTENITIYNISFEQNNFITMPLISSLSSGSIAKINASVVGTQNFNGNLRIKGFFISSLGQNFETFPLEVFFSTGIDQCFLSIVEGDSVVFHNNLLNSINLVNTDNGAIVSSVSAGGTFTQNFPIPQTFNYEFTSAGFPFTQQPSCQVSALGTSGAINDPNLDDVLNLNLLIDFPPTTLEVTIPTQNYTIVAGTSIDDILTIRNTGTQEAIGVTLSSDWFSFSLNNFNIPAGGSRNVGYTINPLITNTTQTNQTHSKILTITGNFPSQNKTFDIFIPFKVVTQSTASVTSLEELINNYLEILKSYCNEPINQNKQVCLDFEKEFANGFNGNSTTGTNTLLEISKALAEMREQMQADINANKISREAQTGEIQIIKLGQNSSNSEIYEIKSSLRNISQNTTFFLVSFLSVIIISIASYLGFKYKTHRKQEEMEEYY